MKKNIMIFLCIPFALYGMQKPTTAAEFEHLDAVCSSICSVYSAAT